MNHLRAIVLLSAFYLGVTSNLELTNIVAGVLIATGVVLLLRMEAKPLRWRELPRALLALARYVLILAYDLVKSGFQVASIVLSPSMPIRQGIAALPAQAETEMGAALSAHAITLTPGEMVVEMDEEGVLYTHCLDATRSQTYIQEAQEMRVELLDKIFP